MELVALCALVPLWGSTSVGQGGRREPVLLFAVIKYGVLVRALSNLHGKPGAREASSFPFSAGFEEAKFIVTR